MELDESVRQKEELEYQYTPSRWSHRLPPTAVLEDHIRTVTTESHKASREVECDKDIQYGDSEKQKLDIFGAKTLPKDQPHVNYIRVHHQVAMNEMNINEHYLQDVEIISHEAPVLIHIHGGYWQEEMIGKDVSCFMCPAFTQSGAVMAIVGYDLAPKVSMDQIVSEVKNAVVYILKWARDNGSRGVYICGHSAGGHLAAMMLAVDWMAECDCSILKGVIGVSGIYDLRPLVKTSVNDKIKMTESDALANSPINQIHQICNVSLQKQVLIVVAEHDSPEFKRQSEEFHEKLAASGITARYIEMEDKDHFNVITNLQFKDYSLSQAICKMMGLISQQMSQA